MKNSIIWGLTLVLGFFIGAIMAGILETAWDFAPIDFGTTASNVLIMLGMIPAYFMVCWAESKLNFLSEKKQTIAEVEARIEEIGESEKADMWENEDFSEKNRN